MKLSIWVINGRDASNWRKGKKTKLKLRPWHVADFDTQAEVDACKIGVSAGLYLTNFEYLTNEEAERIEAEFHSNPSSKS